ncbi:hypothetical protein HMPREF0496_1741 [Lentilactobacillus hilgardii ATCC 27305]|nr:hypothetical protein HMPREF0496_1741 [Lentilactobacillus hilgardii ATCC 27305]
MILSVFNFCIKELFYPSLNYDNHRFTAQNKAEYLLNFFLHTQTN